MNLKWVKGWSAHLLVSGRLRRLLLMHLRQSSAKHDETNWTPENCFVNAIEQKPRYLNRYASSVNTEKHFHGYNGIMIFYLSESCFDFLLWHGSETLWNKNPKKWNGMNTKPRKLKHNDTLFGVELYYGNMSPVGRDTRSIHCDTLPIHSGYMITQKK